MGKNKYKFSYKNAIMTRLQKNWPKHQAIVTKIEKMFKNQFKISYEYEIDGKTYQADQLIKNKLIDIVEISNKMHNEIPIDMYYNPYNSADSCIIKSYDNGILAIILISLHFTLYFGGGNKFIFFPFGSIILFIYYILA